MCARGERERGREGGGRRDKMESDGAEVVEQPTRTQCSAPPALYNACRTLLERCSQDYMQLRSINSGQRRDVRKCDKVKVFVRETHLCAAGPHE